jgi:hypothetical protein
MQRRQVLASLGTLATAAVAGCGGSGGNPPTGARAPTGPEGGGGESGPDDDVGPVTAIPSFEATDFAVYNDSSRPTVEVFVRNPAEQPRTMVLNVSTRVDGELSADRRELSLGPGNETAVNATLPVDYARWQDAGGGLNFDFEVVE